MRDVIETTDRDMRTTERGARSNIQDVENNREKRETKLKAMREAT
jgi:hypothetical protein